MKAFAPPAAGGGSLQARSISPFAAENVVADHAYHAVNARCTCGTWCRDRREHLVHVVAIAVDLQHVDEAPSRDRLYEDGYERGYNEGFADGRNP